MEERSNELSLSYHISFTLTVTQILVSAQESQNAQDEQLQSAQESHDEQRAEKSRNFSANARKIDGVRESQVTVRVCQTGAPIVPFRGMTMFIVLGLVSIAVEFPVLAAYGWIGARGGKLIPERFASLLDRVAGVFLISAGVGLAVVRKP